MTNSKIALAGLLCALGFLGAPGTGTASGNSLRTWTGPDGRTWSEALGTSSEYDAETTCENLGGELPSREDFERAEAAGIRQAIPGFRGHAYWTSTVAPDDTAMGFVFNGDDGAIVPDLRHDDADVRCLMR